uniref:Uncharacterized protein n=1 Tax=Arundo donax TaxID=35708 RepID=A0A0A9CZ54_ARUDO
MYSIFRSYIYIRILVQHWTCGSDIFYFCWHGPTMYFVNQAIVFVTNFQRNDLFNSSMRTLHSYLAKPFLFGELTVWMKRSL